MREKLKGIYRKHPNSYKTMYIFLKIAFIIFRKYKVFEKETIEAIRIYDNKLNKKDYSNKFKKLIVFRYIYCLRANEYYLYNFESASFEEKDNFMTRQLTNRYYSVINKEKYRKIFDRKNLSYEVFKKYYKRDLICVKDSTEFNKLRDFIKDKEKFILKPFSGHSGEGIEIIDISKFKSAKDLFNYTLDKVPYVAEELIIQADGLGCFHKESVNTIRVVTFYYRNDVSILWTFLRTGQGKSAVDNMGSAGFGALIDSETGKIISDGVDWKGYKEEVHPDSKIKFKGYQIPKWSELLDIVKNLASEVSAMHCVGWDLALTDKGWVLVEGNARPQCVTIQTFTKKGYKPYYDKMYTLISKEIEQERKYIEGE